jgi:ADP-heptose:LPS heptosyltransferase
MHSSEAPILFIHQGALGDLLLSLPALYSLRIHHKNNPWTMVGNTANLVLLHQRFYARAIRSHHEKEWAYLYRERPRLPERFRLFLEAFERVYIFAPQPPEWVIRNLRTGGTGPVDWIPSFPEAKRKEAVPAVQQGVLAARGIPWVSPEKTLFPTDQDRQAGLQVLDRIGIGGRPGALPWAIHPGSGGRFKNWPLKNFLALADQLKAQQKRQPFFILGPVEEEASPPMAETIQARGFPLVRRLPLNRLAGLLELSAGYVGNDSGVTHLAAALNLPTVALFGPTDPELWGPAGNRVVILRSQDSAAPGRTKGPLSETERGAWEDLTATEVLAAIQRNPPKSPFSPACRGAGAGGL